MQDMECSISKNEIEKVWDVRPSFYERVLINSYKICKNKFIFGIDNFVN